MEQFCELASFAIGSLKFCRAKWPTWSAKAGSCPNAVNGAGNKRNSNDWNMSGIMSAVERLRQLLAQYAAKVCALWRMKWRHWRKTSSVTSRTLARDGNEYAVGMDLIRVGLNRHDETEHIIGTAGNRPWTLMLPSTAAPVTSLERLLTIFVMPRRHECEPYASWRYFLRRRYFSRRRCLVCHISLRPVCGFAGQCIWSLGRVWV